MESTNTTANLIRILVIDTIGVVIVAGAVITVEVTGKIWSIKVYIVD